MGFLFTLKIRQIKEDKLAAETLELSSKLLKLNPEYYTIWNYRRLIIQHLLRHSNSHSDNSSDHDAMKRLMADDLAFLAPLLRKFPKCYWIWNYRLWLLEQATQNLPASMGRDLWQDELKLVGKMLSIDSRNFHGWGYRRKVVAALESIVLTAETTSKSMIEQEFEYTTKMINTNLSNFSAWHNRSKLIPRLLNERQADHEMRLAFLDKGKR